jgi:hypothetical protein
MPSYFNLQSFYEKYSQEIDQLSEIFPQFDSDEMSLLFYENNCDINLILTRLSSGESFKRKSPKNIVEKNKKKYTEEIPRKTERKNTNISDVVILPDKSIKVEEPSCVSFLFNRCETVLIELPPVVFPFWVPNGNAASLPVFYSFCSKY